VTAWGPSAPATGFEGVQRVDWEGLSGAFRAGPETRTPTPWT